MAKQIQYLDLDGLKVLYGVVDGKITTAVDNAKTELKDGASAEYDTLGKLEGKIKEEVTRATGVETELSDKIGAMDLAEVGGTGKFVQSVSQSDGKVSAEAADLNAAAVAATAISGTDSTVAVEGATVAEQIQSLGQTLKTVEGNAAKYKVVKLGAEEIAKLSDSANVREAYKVVSYVGDDIAHAEQVGEAIKIYKDAALLSVTPENGVSGENTVITFTYSLADGTQKNVSVDLGKAIFESEMGNGMQVIDSKIAIKLDAANEDDFLTVGEGGVKLAGVQAAINAAVAGKNVEAEGDAYITATAANNKVSVSADVQGLTVTTREGGDSTIAGVEKSLVDGKEVADKVASFTNARISEEIAKLDATVGSTTVAEGKHVAVEVVETDGKLTTVSVNESDIASEKALNAEVTRATEAEAKALADAKAYTDGQFTSRTTLAGYGITDAKIEGQIITLGNETLTFIRITEDEIAAAAQPDGK